LHDILVQRQAVRNKSGNFKHRALACA